MWPDDTRDLSDEPRGVWDSRTLRNSSYKIRPVHEYDKSALYYRSAFTDLKTEPGGHTATPHGRVKWLSETRTSPPRLYHAKYFDVATSLARFKENESRMSDDNKKNGWSLQYHDGTSLELLQEEFDNLRQVSKPLPWRVL